MKLKPTNLPIHTPSLNSQKQKPIHHPLINALLPMPLYQRSKRGRLERREDLVEVRGRGGDGEERQGRREVEARIDAKEFGGGEDVGVFVDSEEYIPCQLQLFPLTSYDVLWEEGEGIGKAGDLRVHQDEELTNITPVANTQPHSLFTDPMIVRHRFIQEFPQVFFIHIPIWIFASYRTPVLAQDMFEAADSSGTGQRGRGHFAVEAAYSVFFTELPAVGDHVYSAPELCYAEEITGVRAVNEKSFDDAMLEGCFEEGVDVVDELVFVP
jgi:hypothetical protein